MDRLPNRRSLQRMVLAFWDAEVQQPADLSRKVYVCDVGERERLGLGTGWPAQQIRQYVQFSRSVLHDEGMTLQFQCPAHEFTVLVAHGFDVSERKMIPPDRHRS